MVGLIDPCRCVLIYILHVYYRYDQYVKIYKDDVIINIEVVKYTLPTTQE